MTQCDYELIANTIHKFTPHNSSRAAIDSWLTHMTDVHIAMQSQPPEKPVCLLLDITKSGDLPVAYTLPRLRKWLREHPSQREVRMAVIYNNSMMIALTDSLTRTLNLAYPIRFFRDDRADEALTWLQAFYDESQRQTS